MDYESISSSKLSSRLSSNNKSEKKCTEHSAIFQEFIAELEQERKANGKENKAESGGGGREEKSGERRGKVTESQVEYLRRQYVSIVKSVTGDAKRVDADLSMYRKKEKVNRCVRVSLGVVMCGSCACLLTDLYAFLECKPSHNIVLSFVPTLAEKR